MEAREIKFRAWEIKHQAWIQGFIMDNYHPYFNKGVMPSLHRYDRTWENGEYILEQFTGLLDRKGNPIYEGDIVSSYDPIKLERGEPCDYEGAVEWSNTGAYFIIADKDGKFLNLLSRVEQPTILGNIHENPNLLKG
jgi:uncharacterized phage protein (TIGR01671 family)